MIIFLGMLLSCKTTTEQIAQQENADTTKIVAVQKKDTLESEFYKSLLDSFSFEKYKVMETYNGEIAKLDITHYKKNPKDVREKILYQYNSEKKPNFAGHYIIVTWGCGSPCQMNSIIDAITGKVIFSISTSMGLEYKANSYLIIENPPTNERYDKSYREMFGKPQMAIFKDDKLIEIN